LCFPFKGKEIYSVLFESVFHEKEIGIKSGPLVFSQEISLISCICVM
jgi:hypothetical protein